LKASCPWAAAAAAECAAECAAADQPPVVARFIVMRCHYGMCLGIEAAARPLVLPAEMMVSNTACGLERRPLLPCNAHISIAPQHREWTQAGDITWLDVGPVAVPLPWRHWQACRVPHHHGRHAMCLTECPGDHWSEGLTYSTRLLGRLPE